MKSQESITNYLIGNYIATGKSMTVKEIASATGFSESTARKALQASVDDGVLLVDDEYRESFDRSYGIQVSYHKVATYLPTRTTLLGIIRKLQVTA